MKRFYKAINNGDAMVFTLFGHSFLFSANTLMYFPITECAKEMLLNGELEVGASAVSVKVCDASVGGESAPSGKDSVSVEKDSVQAKEKVMAVGEPVSCEIPENRMAEYLKRYSEKEINSTFEKLKEINANGSLGSAAWIFKPDIKFGDYTLKLVQSTRCNLNCSYCFSRKSKEYDMSVETAKKAILFFLDNFGDGKNCRYIIDLTGSGEPLLRLDFILEVNNFVQELKKERDINIFCQLATNGMLLTKKMSSLLKKNCILFGVSLDGKKEISEKNRAGLKYDVVAKNIQEMENKDFFGLAATYSGNNHDFVEIFKTLYDFGPEVVGMKPVRLPENNPNSINMQNIEEVKDSYDQFAKWMYKQLVSGKKEVFRAFLHSEDYFARFMKIMLHPLRVFYRCSAGVSSIAVDGKENILVCPAFIGKKEGKLGSLDKGLLPEKMQKMENLYADKIPACKNCWARYSCGGECFAEGFLNSGEMEKPVPAMCELKKYLIQLSIYFWTTLRFSHEEIYRECLENY